MTVYGNHPERTTGMLLQPFSSRFAPGILGTAIATRLRRGSCPPSVLSAPFAAFLRTLCG
jgi:hypothetical protein